jgi:hypothetical protein
MNRFSPTIHRYSAFEHFGCHIPYLVKIGEDLDRVGDDEVPVLLSISLCSIAFSNHSFVQVLCYVTCRQPLITQIRRLGGALYDVTLCSFLQWSYEKAFSNCSRAGRSMRGLASSRKSCGESSNDVLILLFRHLKMDCSGATFGLAKRVITLLARSLEDRNCPTFQVTRDVTWRWRHGSARLFSVSVP